MSTTTVQSTTTTTPCPAWCHENHRTGEDALDDNHLAYLGVTAGSREGHPSDVLLVRSLDPADASPDYVQVWIRGDAVTARSVPFTADELLDLAGMFLDAARALRGIEAAS
jgi:hypothetical protein